MICHASMARLDGKSHANALRKIILGL
jgi:hypothetical protein